jgi:hypothetical protein
VTQSTKKYFFLIYFLPSLSFKFFQRNFPQFKKSFEKFTQTIKIVPVEPEGMEGTRIREEYHVLLSCDSALSISAFPLHYIISAQSEEGLRGGGLSL